MTPKSLHRGSVHFHSCPFSVHTLTFLLRPRRSAARTVPRVLAATSLLSKGIRPSTLCSSRLDPRCCYSPGLRRRQTAQQVLARGRRVSISAFPRSSGCALGRGGWRGPPRHGGWTGVAAAAALAAGGAGRGRAGIWVAWSGASRDAPGAAGGQEATASSGGRACRGFPGSTTRAATEHAQSPSPGRGRSAAGGSVAPITRKGLNLRTRPLWAQCSEVAAAAQFNSSWDNSPEARGTGRW